MRLEIVIIADDLTGALDAAAPFAARGLKTVAVTQAQGVRQGLAAGAQVLSVNLGSREIASDEAHARMLDVLAALAGGAIIFKKVDSRLKGNVAEELAAFGARRFLVVPAITEFGRVVKDGAVQGFGVDRPIGITERLGAAAARSEIPDTVDGADMARAIAARHPEDVVVGARGAAVALAAEIAPGTERVVQGLGNALALVIGSRDPITMAQIDWLKMQRPDLVHDRAPGGRSLRTHSEGKGPVLLQAVEGDFPSEEKHVASALGESFARLYRRRSDGVLISGGATAETVLERLGIGQLDVLGEILPGLPVSQGDGLTIISKSGGFGGPDAIVDVMERYGAGAGVEGRSFAE